MTLYVQLQMILTIDIGVALFYFFIPEIQHECGAEPVTFDNK